MNALAFHRLILPVVAMTAVVVASNILVQYPFTPFDLGDYLTWGAFTYPVAFLVTDLTNRRYGHIDDWSDPSQETRPDR